MNYNAILKQYAPLIAATAFRFGLNEDEKQGLRITLWQALKRFNPTLGALGPYLAGNAKFAALNEIAARQRANHKAVPTVSLEGADMVAARKFDSLDRYYARKHLAKMNGRQRSIVTLRLDGLTCGETGAALGISRQRVNVILHGIGRFFKA